MSTLFHGENKPGPVGGPGSVVPRANPLAVLADLAHTQIGAHEVGDNTGPDVTNYQRATTEPGTGWPWCAAFVCWCVAQLALLRPRLLSCAVHKWLPTQASVEALIEWAQDSGQCVQPVVDRGTARRMVDPKDPSGFQPQAGDIACMSFKTGRHCGIVSGPFEQGEMVPTIEGNTSGPYHNNQDERNGGEVAAKLRPLGCITHFIRLTIEAEPVNTGKPTA